MKTPNVILSGCFSTSGVLEKKLLDESGCRHRCFSFAFVVQGEMHYNKRMADALAYCEKRGIHIMLDSGAASLHRIERDSTKKRSTKEQLTTEQLQEKMFSKYADYCLANKHKWSFYITLDWKREQPLIYGMQKKFAKLGLAPAPVFHGGDSIEWLKKHKDMGHTLICIGGKQLHKGKRGLRTYLDTVFNYGAKHDLKFHGLALTSLHSMTTYDWQSVDSSSWTRTASFGCLNFPDVDRNTIYNLHVSKTNSATHSYSYNKMGKVHKAQVKEAVKNLGFDVDELAENEFLRNIFNAKVYSNLDKLGIDFEKEGRQVQWATLL